MMSKRRDLEGGIVMGFFSIKRGGRAALTLVAVFLSVSVLAGCGPAAPAGNQGGTGQGTQPPAPPVKKAVLDPQVIRTKQIPYYAYSNDPAAAVSPDGKYVLMVQRSQADMKIAATPIAASGDDVVLYSVSADWMQNSSIDYLPIGWLSNTEALFISVGWQSQGPNKGDRGAEVLIGDVTKGTSRQLTFIPLPTQGEYLSGAAYSATRGKLFIEVPRAIWAVDLVSKSAKEVAGNLPTYDGLFYSRVAPDASAYVYQLHEAAGDHGVYILDTATGEQKPFVLNGDTMCFYPEWSPDGKYVAMYEVARQAGATGGTTWDQYATYPGEDAPRPVGTSIRVVDRSGKTVRTISAEGKVLGSFKWSLDSKSIAFIATAKPASAPDTTKDWIPTEFTWDSVWIAPATVDGAATKLAPITVEKMGRVYYAQPMAFDAAGKGVFFQADSDKGGSVWYAAQGGAPVQSVAGEAVKVTDGYWGYPVTTPVYLGFAVGITGTPDGKGELWLLSPDSFVKAAGWDCASTTLVGYDSRSMVTIENNGSEGQDTLVIRSMITEK